MRQDICDKILSILASKSNLSSTGIAKECGFSKASSIVKELDELMTKRCIIQDSSGPFIKYVLNQTIQKSQDSSKVETITLPKNGDNGTLPEATSSLMSGYKISDIKVDGKRMKKIICPNGKAVKIDSEEKLLVINGEPRFVVETADEILTCIKKYSQDNQLTVFTVDDIRQNKKIATEKDIEVKDEHILFLTIKKHNKAADISLI